MLLSEISQSNPLADFPMEYTMLKKLVDKGVKVYYYTVRRVSKFNLRGQQTVFTFRVAQADNSSVITDVQPNEDAEGGVKLNLKTAEKDVWAFFWEDEVENVRLKKINENWAFIFNSWANDEEYKEWRKTNPAPEGYEDAA